MAMSARLNFVDWILKHAIHRKFSEGVDERPLWEKHWKEQLCSFDRNHGPREQRELWSRDCDSEMTRAYAKLFHGLEGKSVLELGCGSGHISILMAAHAERVTLVDLSPSALEYARRIASYLGLEHKITFVEGDMFSIDIEPHDACFNCGVIEHFSNQQAIALLRQMGRLAREVAAVTVPNLLSPELIYRMLRYGKGSERFMTPKFVTGLIREAGLEPLRWEPVNYWTPSPFGHSLAGMARDMNLIRLHWALSWLFTCTFRNRFHEPL
ncbi:MAG TPA: methyltransferase domain-containing protein [Pyrinomonadaceae bacterium]|jgi:SAM-dependent methyltransferase